MANTYEQVCYRTEDSKVRRKLILRNTKTIEFFDTPCLMGVQVNSEGDEVIRQGAEQHHAIALSLIHWRKPMTMNLKYATLEVSNA
jgi:hypothetical protein